jgi:hypothetical protein
MRIKDSSGEILIALNIVSGPTVDASTLVKNVDPPLMGRETVLFAGKRVEHVEAEFFHKPVVNGWIDFQP